MERSGIREVVENPDSGPTGLHPGYNSTLKKFLNRLDARKSDP